MHWIASAVSTIAIFFSSIFGVSMTPPVAATTSSPKPAEHTTSPAGASAVSVPAKQSTETAPPPAPAPTSSKIKIEGTIPDSIFAAADKYLVSRLGAAYVEKNIVLASNQTEKQSNYPSYRINYVDTRFTGVQGSSVTYAIDVKAGGSIDQTWMPVNNDIPDCVTYPTLCEIKINKDDAVAQAEQSGLFAQVPSAHIHAGSMCKTQAKGRAGWYWVFSGYSGGPVFETNLSSGDSDSCNLSVGDF